MLARVFFTVVMAVSLCFAGVYAVVAHQGLERSLEWAKNIPDLNMGYYYAVWCVVSLNSVFFLINFLHFSDRIKNPRGNLTGLFITSCLLVLSGSFLCLYHNTDKIASFVSQNWIPVDHWTAPAFVAALVLNIFMFMLCVSEKSLLQVSVECPYYKEYNK